MTAGEESIRRRMDRAKPPDLEEPDDCPVVALGHRKGTYYFLSASGERREVKPRDMTQLGLISLFDGEGAWLIEHYGKFDKKDRKTGELDINRAASAMIRRCVQVGLWREDTPERSIGVWREPELGGIVAHCGDQLVWFHNGHRKVRRSGFRQDDVVYIGAPPIVPPASTPATREQARTFYEAIKTLWRYEAAYLPLMAFGFTASGMLGQAPRWHVHILLAGEPGSGKSTLLKLMRAGIGDQCAYYNDPSEAGLRERLTGEARTIFYDEGGTNKAQRDERSMKVAEIIGLLRRMAEEEGAQSVRGSGAGAREYRMAGSAALAAANPPLLDEQDRSRILEIGLLKGDPANESKVMDAIAAIEKLSPAFRSRALMGWQRFVDNLALYRAALIDAKCTSRQADQLGTLFAAAEMMLHDEPIDNETASTQIGALATTITDYRARDLELSNAQRCYGALMTFQVEHWQRGAKSTLGRLVALARDGTRTSEREALPIYGLRLEELTDGAQELWVANVHRGLDRVFDRTDWASGGWARALRGLPGAEASSEPRQFSGHKSRFTIIPAKYLPDPPPPPPPGTVV